MRVLLAGGAGYIGSHTAVELLDGDKISIGRVNFLFVLPPKSV